MKGIFITGTGTDVGKTLVSAWLARSLRADYWKPIQTGSDCGTDQEVIAKLAPQTHIHPSRHQFSLPLSPHAAAELSGTNIAIDDFCLPPSQHMIIVEGAGGLLVPLNDDLLMIDLIIHLSLPTIIVGHSGLGTINHTLLTIEMMRQRSIEPLGVILSGPINNGNRQAITRFSGVPVMGELPFLTSLSELDDVDDFEFHDDCMWKQNPPYPPFTKGGALSPPPLEKGGRGDFSPQDISALDSRHIWHPFTQEKTAQKPLLAKTGHGAFIETDDGRQLLDLVSSWWVNLHGHAHPAIAQAITNQANLMEQTLFADFTHGPAVELASRICALLPGDLNRLFYSDDGSTAVEVALKISLQFFQNNGNKKKTRLLAFDCGYHGDTVGAMSLGQSSGFFRAWDGILFPVETIAFPETWLGDEHSEEKEHESLKILEQKLSQDVAAVIIEPLIQGAGGMRMCSAKFLQNMAQMVKSSGALLIFDEVMTGFGRTGEIFACLTAQLSAQQTPDLICLSKGITGGFLPMAATIASDRIYEAFLSEKIEKAFLHGHSYTANPLGCAAAIASLDLLLGGECQAQRTRIAAIHRERLSSLKLDPRIYHQRSCGTIAALTMPEGRYGDQDSARIKAYFLEQNMLVRPIGSVIYFLPPYCISENDLHRSWDVMEKALGRIENPPYPISSNREEWLQQSSTP